MILIGKKMDIFLVISGQITESKRREFEQTYRLAISTLTGKCLAHSLSYEPVKDGYYHFFSLWADEETLKKFMESMEYQLMKGAFHALGNMDRLLTGKVHQTRNHLQSNHS
jgi:quinol monooxygenase YgiN